VASELGVEVASGLPALLGNPAVEGVLIASSTDTHVDLMVAAVGAATQRRDIPRLHDS
jgi:predicted dehydrogenase